VTETTNDLAELKQYVEVHARGQRMAPEHYRAILGRIDGDDDGPGSWAVEWTRAGERLEGAGDLLGASRHYAMARFPFVNGEARRAAHERGLAVFDRWRKNVPGIERLDLELPDGTVRCWTSGLSTTDRKPLLIVSGGIVTVKEQWAAVLARGARLGLAGVVIELPGVGENTLPYSAQSSSLLSAILDELADRADVGTTYALAMSFSGHLALRAAAGDQRIKGVVTTCAPISAFFTDTAWQAQVPRITTDTLAHLVGTKPSQVYDEIRDWALPTETLENLTIPVAYAASLRDEIIPQDEVRLLREHVRKLDVVAYDDVHGSPAHTGEVGLWTILSILKMAGGRQVPRALLTASLTAQKARRRIGL
jgi:esterase FrsA